MKGSSGMILDVDSVDDFGERDHWHDTVVTRDGGRLHNSVFSEGRIELEGRNEMAAPSIKMAGLV